MRKIKEFFTENHHLFFWPVVAALIFLPAVGKYTMFPAPDATPVYSQSFKTDLARRFFTELRATSVDDVLQFVMPPLFYHDFAYWLAVVLVALGFYWFMRERDVTRPAALFSAGAMAFAGYSFTLLSAGHMAYFSMWPYVCFTFAFLTRAVRRDDIASYFFAACTAAWAFRYGPDIAPQFLVVAAAYAIHLCVTNASGATAKKRWISFAKGCLMALVGFALVAAPSIYNTCTNTLKWRREQIVQSSGTALTKASVSSSEAGDNDADAAAKKEEQWIFATNWSLPPEEFVEFVAPGVYGTWSGDQSAPYWGRLGRSAGFDFKRPQQTGFFNFRQHLIYLGALPVACMIFAMVYCFANVRRKRNDAGTSETPQYVADIPFWIAIWLIALLLAFGRYAPFYRLFYSIPYMSYLRAPVKFFRIVEFASMVLAASGLATLISDRVGEKFKKGFGYGALAASAALVIYAMRINSSAGTFASDLGKLGAPQLMKPMAVHAIHALWHGILGFALVGAAAFALSRRRVAGGVVAMVLSVALAIDAWVATRPFMFTSDFSNWYAPNHVTKTINADVKNPDLGALMVLGVQRIPDWFTKSMSAAGIRNLPFENADNSGFIERSRGDIVRFCKASTASHLIIPVSLSRSIDRSAFEHISFIGFSANGLTEVKNPTATSLEFLRVRNRVPFCSIYGKWKYASDDAWLETIVNNDDDGTMIVGKEIVPSEDHDGGVGTATIKSRSCVDGKFDTIVETDSPSDTICVIGHLISSNQRVLVDGSPADVIPCGFAKCVGVHLPAGKHVVSVGLEPHYFIGAYSILSMVIFFALVIWRHCKY